MLGHFLNKNWIEFFAFLRVEQAFLEFVQIVKDTFCIHVVFLFAFDISILGAAAPIRLQYTVLDWFKVLRPKIFLRDWLGRAIDRTFNRLSGPVHGWAIDIDTPFVATHF